MGMSVCKDCGGRVSTKATRCPFCGRRVGVPQPIVWVTAVFGATAVVAFVIVWLVVLSG
jgi:uncharacterized OB-fold protein